MRGMSCRVSYTLSPILSDVLSNYYLLCFHFTLSNPANYVCFIFLARTAHTQVPLPETAAIVSPGRRVLEGLEVVRVAEPATTLRQRRQLA